MITLWTGSGVMISWMEGFRRCYELPKSWGLVKERFIAFSLVILAGIPLTSPPCLSPSAIASKPRSCLNSDTSSALHSVDVDGHPLADCRTYQHRGHRAHLSQCGAADPTLAQRLPGATLASALWFSATALFGWYLQRYADYSILYGSLGVGIALLVWMYMISLVVLVGAEFNAMLFPRARLGIELIETNAHLRRP